MTTIYRVTGFEGPDVPHYEVAFVEAHDEDDALNVMLRVLETEEGRERHHVWTEPEDPESWKITEAARPLLFILGGGCR